MGFLKNLKGKKPNKDELDSSQDQAQSSSTQKHTYVSQTNSPEITYEKPFSLGSASYKPPPGPPPSHVTSESNPPPYESWLSVPDNSQLPPPPSMFNEFSPANNASAQSAEMGHQWCDSHQLYTPTRPHNATLLESSQAGELGLDHAPPGFKGSIRQLDNRSWEIKTDKRQQDAILMSALPVYFAAVSNPLLSEAQSSPRTVTFSFSVTICSIRPDAIVAIGFVCKPYPSFRLPGWHRGSLAVHSDDGNRYISNPYGGIDFMRPFQQGDQVRITMSINPQSSPVQQYQGKLTVVKRVGNLPKCVTRVQVERNGRTEGAWDVHEERDAETDEGIEGLQGEADLYCAVGVSGVTNFVLNFENQ